MGSETESVADAGKGSVGWGVGLRRRGVPTDNGKEGDDVTVTGTTHSPSVLDAIPGVARQVEGVTDVRNEVRFLREGAAGAPG